MMNLKKETIEDLEHEFQREEAFIRYQRIDELEQANWEFEKSQERLPAKILVLIPKENEVQNQPSTF
jgi:hypothetical protein